MTTRVEELLWQLTERLWTVDLLRAFEEVRARHPDASFELAGVEVALTRALESLAQDLCEAVPSPEERYPSPPILGNG